MPTRGSRQPLGSGRGAELIAPDGARVRVHTFPPDPSLMRDVVGLWQRLAPDRADSETLRTDLERELHRWYPLLAIQVQSELGSVEAELVWYVFRDGRVRTARPLRDEYYAALSRARDVQESLEDTVRRARDTLEMANRPRGRRSPARRSGPSEPASGGD